MKDQLKTIRDALEAVLCDPEGKCCIAGSDADRAEVDKALTALSELERMAVDQEPILIVQHGEICYKSQDDDQSYGMWCPVTPDAEHGLRNGTQLYTTPPAQQPQHDHVAVTWDAARTRILAVTLQDAEGRVLCVIDEAPAQQPQAEAYSKTELNAFVQDLYDRKMREGKHGHYETLFHCVHQAIKRVGPQSPPAWEHHARKLTRWLHCMSYNDSYFGEPAGLVKQVTGELNRLIGTAPQQAEVVPPDVVRDAERWRMLPAYFYEYQIDAMKLYRDIDAAIAQQKGGV